MTDHTPAAQAAMQEAVLTDLEIQETLGAVFVTSHPYGRRDVLSQWEWEKAAARAIEQAVLSKLRATVADELVDTLARYAYYYAVDLDRHTRNADLDQLEGISRRATAKLKAEIRAALASAPVAGEAQDAARWRAYATQFPQVSSVFLQVHGDPAPQATQVERQDRAGDFIKLAEAIVKAHESMFAQCCSNPVRNAWGVEVNMLPLNQAYELARAALSAQPGAQKKREAPYA